MKLRALIPLIAGLTLSTTGHAGITNVTYYGNYNFSCTATVDYNQDHSVATLNMDAYQTALLGRMWGEIYTDSAVDPSLVIGGSVDNDTGQSWTGYDITVYMNRAFTLTGVGSGPLPPGWSFTASGVAPGPGKYYTTEYFATIHFNGGVPVLPGGEFDFHYTLNFAGSTGYSFTADMNPVVPEPSTAGLALLGTLVFAGYRRSRRSA